MNDPTTLVLGLGGGLAAAAFLLVVLGIAKAYLYICRPDEILIFSGRTARLEDGTERGYRVVFGGRAWRVPMLERVDRMTLNLMEVEIHSRNAMSKGGIRLHVDAIANVKISSNPLVIGNAITRFLGHDLDEIRRVARETLEGHLRGVLATLTPEEINEDRLKFTAEISRETEEDLVKLGLHLDTVKILHVEDDTHYLSSMGREAIANVIRTAEIAESNAKREAEQAEAQHAGRANITVANVDAQIAQMTNELRKLKAEVEAKVQVEEEKTTAAARQARASAEFELQGVRAELEAIRLKADTVLPAEAQKVERELHARGEAAVIRARGNAMGETLALLNTAWREAGDDALSIYLIEELEKILATVAAGVKKVKVKNLRLIDGGDGHTLPAYVSAYPAMMSAVFDAIAQTTGIDIPAVVSGRRLDSGANGEAGALAVTPSPSTHA